MLLWKFKEEPETRGPSYPCTAFRWVIEATLGRRHVAVVLINQHRWRSTGEWQSSHAACMGINITDHLDFGIKHMYYDGPHCSLSLGPVHIIWSGNPLTGHCDKCLRGEAHR